MRPPSAASALDGFVHLLASQVITRLFTFGLNLFTARSLSPQAYGVAAVQFHLINTTILFLSREGLRRGCLRVDQGAEGATRRVLGAAAIVVPVGALLSAGVTAGLLAWAPPGDAIYRRALIMQGLAAFIELLAEPLYILASTRLYFGLRVGVEGVAMGAKGLATLALLRLGAVPPALAFSWGQLAYAGVTLAGYAVRFAPELAAALGARARRRPGAGTAWGWELDRGVLRTSGAFSLQAVEKLLLAEGSKMVVATQQGSYDQGVYGLVANLGSLVVRTLFQPLEEAAFAAFSRAQGQRSSSAQLLQQARLLGVLTRSVATVALLAAAFGPAYSYLALLLAYSARWADTEAPFALGLYSQYLVLLALNGTLEAFVHGVASRQQLHAVNLWLVGFAAAHALASVAAVRAAGACGLIAADALNMLLRIAYCMAFVGRRFGRVPGFRLRQLLPSAPTLAACAAALAVTSASRLVLLPESSALQRYAALHGVDPSAALLLPPSLAKVPELQRAALHIGVGCACLAAVAATMLRSEGAVLRELRELRKGEKAL